MLKLTSAGVVLLCAVLLLACSPESPPQAESKLEAGAKEIAQGVGKLAEGTREAAVETAEKVKEEAVQAAEMVKEEAVAATDKAVTASKEVAASVSQAVTEAKKEVVATVTAPGVVTYEASQGTVTFNHAGHLARLACADCHATDPPQMIALGKDAAHALCRGCHRESGGNAPTACSGCHKK